MAFWRIKADRNALGSIKLMVGNRISALFNLQMEEKMVIIIIAIWISLMIMFVWLANKLPDKFGWWCMGIMLALILYLPVTISISKIIPSCPSCLQALPDFQIPTENMSDLEHLKSFLEDSGIEEWLEKN